VADTPFVDFAFPVIGGNAKRTMPARLNDVVNVLDFTGVDPTGATDSLAGIQAAIAAAIAKGSTVASAKGATIFFPPGAYLVSGSISNNISNTAIRLVGSGRKITRIFGNFAGFIINQDGNPSGICAIEHMTVSNSRTASGTNLTIGAIQFNNVQNGLINSVEFKGWTGICMTTNPLATGWETMILNCGSTGGPPMTTNDGLNGSIGIYSVGGGVGIYNTECLGYNIGMCICHSANNLARTRTETCCTGLLLGYDPNVSTGSFSASTVQNHTTERCDTAMLLHNVTEVVLSGCVLTGTLGTWKGVASIVGAGGIATVTSALPLSNFGWSLGTKQVLIESASVAGFNTGGFVTATRTGANTFTYANTAVGTDSSGWPTWSFQCQYGLRVRTWGMSAIIGLSAQITNIANAGIDLYYDGRGGNQTATGSAGLSMISCFAGTAGWMLPGAFGAKSNVQYISCDQPRGTTLDKGGNIAGMKFGDLPGQPGVWVLTALEGMEYDIIDCNSSTFLATAAGGGTGATAHRKVRYNAALPGWQVIG
jgi:hypothetical protein